MEARVFTKSSVLLDRSLFTYRAVKSGLGKLGQQGRSGDFVVPPPHQTNSVAAYRSVSAITGKPAHCTQPKICLAQIR